MNKLIPSANRIKDYDILTTNLNGQWHIQYKRLGYRRETSVMLCSSWNIGLLLYE